MTITLIPARANSKRLPGKNVMEFCGLPLVAHSIKYAQSSDVVSQVVVSTDDQQVKDIAINLGAMVIDRPRELGTDHTPTIAVLQHALEILGDEVQNIILLQPTNPLRPLKLMDEALDYFEQNDLKSLFTVSQMHRKIGQITNGAFQPLNYSIWIQIKLKLFKGDFRAFFGLMLAILDLIFNLPRVLKNAHRLTSQEFHKYIGLKDAKLYWSP